MDLKSLFLTLTILSMKLQYLNGAAKKPNLKCWEKSSETKEIYKPKPNIGSMLNVVSAKIFHSKCGR